MEFIQRITWRNGEPGMKVVQREQRLKSQVTGPSGRGTVMDGAGLRLSHFLAQALGQGTTACLKWSTTWLWLQGLQLSEWGRVGLWARLIGGELLKHKKGNWMMKSQKWTQVCMLWKLNDMFPNSTQHTVGVNKCGFHFYLPLGQYLYCWWWY